MLSRVMSNDLNQSYAEKIEILRYELETADAVVVGAGAGLSAAAGFTYDGARFIKYFSDFEEKYGFHDMYSGGFYPYQSLEEYWAYWSRYIYVNRYMDAPKPVYDELLNLVREKDYFVITTNVDHCFQKAGFDKKRLFYTQGDYGLFQCSEPCRSETFDNKDIILAMTEKQKDGKIPPNLVPKCPYCGKPLTVNLRADDKFVQDNGWDKAAERYANFLRTRQNQSVLYLELGVGYNTPVIIKYPFWQMTAENPRAVYACINDREAVCPREIENQSICITGDISDVLARLRDKRQRKCIRKQG